MSADVTRTWAGSPSRIATRDGPWDSPAVSQRSMPSVFHDQLAAISDSPGGEMEPDPGPRHHAEQRADQHERPERELRLQERAVPARQRDQQTRDTEEQERAVGPDEYLSPAEVAEGESQQRRQPDVAESHAARPDPPEHPEAGADDQHRDQRPDVGPPVVGDRG